MLFGVVIKHISSETLKVLYFSNTACSKSKINAGKISVSDMIWANDSVNFLKNQRNK